jgi:RHS repeat-associated protein
LIVDRDYDEQDRLTQYGDIAYTHTEAGERLTRTDSSGTTTYTYDAHTNLRQVSLPDGAQIEYLIDGRDRRVGKKIDGVVQKTWIYRDQLSPVAQFDDDGNLTHRFVYAEQGHSPSWMVMIDPVTEAETVYRFITDHLGSVRLVIDVAAGAVAQRIDYGPFGEVLFDSNPGLQPFGFAGGIYDQHAGLVRFGARDYDPQAGRWTAKDPIDFGGGDFNFYGFVSDDPINYFDPEGLARKGENKQKIKNPNKKPPPAHRVPGGNRERNVGHPKGEEHSRRPKGGFRSRALLVPGLTFEVIQEFCREGRLTIGCLPENQPDMFFMCEL